MMTNTADVHVLVLHETNSGGWLPTCTCGWYGVVHPCEVEPVAGVGVMVWPAERAKGRAAAEHRDHLKHERETARGITDAQAVAIVRNPARFTHA